MIRLIVNTFLFLISIALLLILSPLGIVFTFIASLEQSLKHRKTAIKNAGINYASASMLNNGFSLDVFGNVICKDLFNAALLKEPSGTVPFGNPRMSISGVLGLNAELNNLTYIGQGLGLLLDLLDKDHLAKAADNNRPFIQ